MLKNIKLVLTIILVNFNIIYCQDIKKLRASLSALTQSLYNLNKKLPAVPAVKTTKYTESQAHLSLDSIRQLITHFYGGNIFKPDGTFTDTMGNLGKYKKIITTALEREKRYKDTHYVFYHASASYLRIPSDLNLELCKLKGVCPDPTERFIFLRTFSPDYFNLGNLNKWVEERFSEFMATHPGPKDAFNNYYKVQPYLLATNLALFGNTGRANSNTFNYFRTSFTAKPPPMVKILDSVISPYITDATQKANFINLADSLTPYVNVTHEGILLQIFIPKHLVDQLVYLSRERGFFWNIQVPGIESWQDTIPKRYTKISPMLETYENKPKKLDVTFPDPGNPGQNIIIDRLEGRILLRGEYFDYPQAANTGIKIYRYKTTSQAQEQNYMAKLKALAKQIYKVYKP